MYSRDASFEWLCVRAHVRCLDIVRCSGGFKEFASVVQNVPVVTVEGEWLDVELSLEGERRRR
jgi:hypothetical protein